MYKVKKRYMNIIIKLSNNLIEKGGIIVRGHRIMIYPTESQKSRLLELMNLSRFIYNWTLGLQMDNFKAGNKYIRFYDLCKILKDFRNSPENEWLKRIPINTARHAVIDANQAFMNFFEKRTKHPVFKTKKRPNLSYTTRGDRLYFEGDYVRLEGFPYGEKILCKKNNIPKHDVVYYNATISTDGINFFLSVNTESKIPIEFDHNNEAIGIDLGLKNFATLSDGTVYNHPNLIKINRRRKHFNRLVERDRLVREKMAEEAKTKPEAIKWTKGMIKRYNSYKKACIKRHNIIDTSLHQITTAIVKKQPSAIVIETLDVKEMIRNKYLKKEVCEASFYKFKEYLSYKCENENIPLIKASMWYPSSKLCSNCGNKYEVGRANIYKCPVCGLSINRDLNAALNLKKLAT